MSQIDRTDETLKEIRKLAARFDELSIQIRVDTPWVRVRNHVRYGVHVLSEIPVLTRICCLVATGLATFALFCKLSPDTKKKLYMVCLNILQVGMVAINYG